MEEPVGSREVAEKSVLETFPKDGENLAKEMKWDSLNGCFYFHYFGMYIGIETDGYIHS